MATLPNLLLDVPSVQPEAHAGAIPQRDRCVGSHLRARGGMAFPGACRGRGSVPAQEWQWAEGVQVQSH